MSQRRTSPAEIRARIQAERQALPQGEAARLSREICERFLRAMGEGPEVWSGKRIALYRAFPGELDPSALEPALLSAGARLCFPRVLDRKAAAMEFAELPEGPRHLGEGVDPSWPTGRFGIEEPPAHFERVDPSRLDLVIVPGVAFGPAGERVGMGGGFYDRFLPSAPRALRVALAFDFQLLPALEQDPWDQRVHWIITERRELRHSKP